jgi:hypothetical protein
MNLLNLMVDEPVYEWNLIKEKATDSDHVTLYIEGPYLMAEKKNKNGRVYKLDEMCKDVDRYVSEMVKQKRSIGELNHPESIEVNPERACHMIVEMKQDNNIFIGKSKILSNPMGQIVKCLINDGVRLGVSSRALGQLESKNGDNLVSNFRFICEVVVHDPSVSSAFVNGIMESKQYILESSGNVVQYEKLYNNFEKELDLSVNRNTKEIRQKAVISFIKSLKCI